MIAFASAKTAVRRAARVLAAAVGLALVVSAGPALAQRGEDFAPTEELAVSPNPNQGFPGLFDTEVAQKGAFVANLPATSLYYGVTPRLTIGTISAAFASVLYGPPGASVHARYLVGGATWFRSTADALLLASAVSLGGAYTTLRLGIFSSNTELLINPSNRFTAHAWLVHVGAELGELSATGNVFLVGGTYSVALASWAALHVTGLYAVSATASGGDPRAILLDGDFTNAVGVSDRLFARATVSMRRGRWLFDLGAFHAGPVTLPWFNVALQVGT
jgi:hypothetical protein